MVYNNRQEYKNIKTEHIHIVQMYVFECVYERNTGRVRSSISQMDELK